MHSPVHHFERLLYFNGEVGAEFLHKALKNGASNVAMGAFTAAEDHLHFHFVALLKELLGLIYADLQVAFADAHGKTNTLDFHLFGLRPLFAHLLLFLILEVAVIGEFTHRWLCFWRNLDQVHASLLCHGNCLRGGQNAKWQAIFVDHAHLWNHNVVVRFELLNFELWFLKSAVAVNAHCFGVKRCENDRPKREIVLVFSWA